MAQTAPLVDTHQDGEEVHQVQLSWSNITYTVKEKSKSKGKGKGKSDGEPSTDSNGKATESKGQGKGTQKTILDKISGHADPGNFTAIIGASGSGKTSLLSVLADRLLVTKGAELTGELLLNGQSAPADYRTRCAFVQQVEVFYPYSTVRETLEMAARMRLGSRMPKDQKKQRSIEVATQLGLSKCLDTYVGDGGRIKGISGGEMKRVGIACELVSSPSLLMLDEPTSGLDSFAALNVVLKLKGLAKSGRNIIASIHQPGSAIFAEFDNIILLAEGRLSYFGPASGVIEHFSKINFACPQNFNPADYMVMVASIDYTSETTENECRQALVKIHSNSENSVPPKKDYSGSGPGPAVENQCSFGEQFTLLFRRVLNDALRNYVAILIKVGTGLFTSLLMVFLYAKMRDGQVLIIVQSNVTALIFFITITGLFGPLFGTIQSFSPEVSIVIRERMNNLYDVGPYYLAKLLVAIPMELIPLLIQNTLTFWLLQFTHSFDRYLVYLIFTSGMTFATIGIGFVLAVLAGGNVQAASAGVGPIALLFLLLGGFYINTSTIPIWISWFSKIEYVRFVYEGLAINEFNRNVLAVKGSNTIEGDGCKPGTSSMICQTGPQVLAGLFTNGEQMTESEWAARMWLNFGYIAISIAVFWVLGYVILLFKGPKYLTMRKSTAAADAAAVTLA